MSARVGIVLVASGLLGLSMCSCATEGRKVKRASHSYSQYISGLLNDRLGNIDEAVHSYQQAQESDQHAPALHIQLGLDYIRLKKFKDATSEFEKAVRLAPDDDDARYVLSLLYVQLNDLKKAAAQYEFLLGKNLDHRSQNIQLRRILSQLYFLEEDYRSAGAQCAKILQLDPVDEWGLYLLAMIDSEEGRAQKAIENFKEVLKHYPDNIEAANALAYLYAEEDQDLDKAVTLAEKAVESDPSEGAYLDTLGWVYFKIGETDKAIEYLKKASNLLIDPVILNHLAEAYYKKGSKKEAKDYWTSSLKIDPMQKSVRTRLETLFK